MNARKKIIDPLNGAAAVAVKVVAVDMEAEEESVFDTAVEKAWTSNNENDLLKGDGVNGRGRNHFALHHFWRVKVCGLNFKITRQRGKHPNSLLQISFHGRPCSISPKTFSFGIRHRIVLGPSNEIRLRGLSLKAQTATNDINLSSEAISVIDTSLDTTVSSSGLSDYGNDLLLNLKTITEDFIDHIDDSIKSLENKGENAVGSSVKSITSSFKSIIKGASKGVDKAASGVYSTVEQTGEVAGNKLENLSSNLKEASGKVGVIAIDQLRHIIVLVEESLTGAANLVLFYYGSAKGLLPPEIQKVLNTSETESGKFLRPVGRVLHQIYTTIEGMEKSLGFDPADPIVPFVLLLGTSVTLWVFYWRLTYGGYAGNVSPKLTLELLKGKEKTVLIDVRPEDFRERDGIPDLRRAARSRYESVTLPEVDGSLRKLLKSGKDLDNALISVVIRSLKVVQDRPKIIVMDADGTHSKGIARSLRNFGIKKPYIVEGGFQSWVKEGLRIKELKPETTLTILNEEAEAIFEDIRPSPVQILGFGVGSLAAVYALLEWEKTLQLIGLVGLGQTIYWRVLSYEDSEAFKKDLRMLLGPVKVGTQAFSWAAGKLESNGIGIPTSPSPSLDVQNRVLQAAAKHESQSSIPEEVPATFFESTGTTGEVKDDIFPET